MKWFKHDSDANTDAKLKRLKHKYGLAGNGLYWYCIELIAGNVSVKNITFELEEDAEIIAREWNHDQMMVQEMMEFMVNIGLFDKSANDRIRCFTLAKRLDDTNSKNPQIRKILDHIEAGKSDLIGDSPSDSEKLLLDKNRLDKSRLNNNIKNKQKVTPLDFSLMNLSDEEIKEVKRIRKANKGGAITQRVINALAKEFSQARSGGMTTDEILTEWEMRGWKSFKSEWVKQKQTGANYERHDTTRLSAVDRSREAINRKRKERGLAPLTRDGHGGQAVGEDERDVWLQVPESVRGDSGRRVDSVLIEHRGQEDCAWPPKMP